jgi:hypothetical protein
MNGAERKKQDQGGRVMVSLDRTKEEIEKYLLEAKSNGAIIIFHSFFFTFLPNLQDEMMEPHQYIEYEPKNWVYHLEVSYRPPDENDFRLFHLGIYPYQVFTSEVWETRNWLFKKITSLGMTAEDSHEQLEAGVESVRGPVK